MQVAERDAFRRLILTELKSANIKIFELESPAKPAGAGAKNNTGGGHNRGHAPYANGTGTRNGGNGGVAQGVAVAAGRSDKTLSGEFAEALSPSGNVYIYIYMCVCVCAYLPTCLPTSLYICIYIYIDIYIYRYLYLYLCGLLRLEPLCQLLAY